MNDEQVKQLFAYAHLPEDLQAVSKPFHDLAMVICKGMPNPGNHRTEALKDLWQSKNWVVAAYAAER